jgi:Fe-S cluster assembly protein SufD
MSNDSEQALKELNPYIAAFEEFEKTAEAQEHPWLRPLRMAGIAYFGELGFPTLKHENWRYTQVAPIKEMPFLPAFKAAEQPVAPENIARFQIDGLTERLVFVDGKFRKNLSHITPRTDGVRLESLAAAFRTESAIKEHFGGYARLDDHAFRALNAAFFQDGAFIWVPRNVQVAEPIHLINISTAHQEGLAVHPRNLIVVEEGGRIFIQESFVSLGQAPSLTNSVTEIVVGANARVEYAKLQDEHPQAFHIATLQARLARNSHYTASSISSGARISRHDINTVMAGEGCECVLNGLFLGTDKQLVDHHMVVDHAKAHCASHEFFNGILGGHSRGVFSGKIMVRKDAQKTDAKQSNRNILLSNDATVDTKPQLEIFADDVKCTHGATVGQLDEESVFYLRSRGIDKDAARRMLTHAFGGEIINRVGQANVRARLDAFLIERLPRI